MNNIQQFEANNLFQTLLKYLPGSPVVKTAYSLIPYLIVFLILCLIAYILGKLLVLRMLLREEQILLEITPPSLTEKESYTTEQLFSLIQSLGQQRSLKDKLLGKKVYFSLEIVSTRNEGIRYLIRTTPEKASILRKTLISYLPQITIKEVKDYLPESYEQLKERKYEIIDFKLANHFAFPLKKHNLLEKYDPISYITGMMTKLSPEELISLQIVLTPVRIREARKVQKFILRNGDVLHYLNSPKLFRMLSNPPSKTLNRQSISEKDIVGLINEKVEQPLFETSIRLLLISDREENISERVSSISSSFSSFSSSEYQSITSKKHLGLGIINKLLFFAFRKRLTFLNKSYFSVSEISSIYHFPFANTASTEDLVKTHSKELPAPLSLKKGHKYDVMFGKNNYGGTTTDIGLTEEERETHMYIIGRTGSGKTTMMFSMAKHDIERGRGMAFLDPHGDAADDLVSIIPKERLNDLVFINPIDLKYPIGINILELTKGLDEDELELEKEVVCEGVISLFRKVFSKEENTNAHRIEYILRNAIYTAFTIENRTIFTIYDLLNNPPFQQRVLAKLKDENLKNFWKYEFGRAGDYQVVKMVGGVTAKIGRFLFSPTAKRILEQPKSTINFDKLMNEGKIIICNLSQGKLGEDTSKLLGTTIMTKIQQAALKRSNLPESKRKPFYLYVDEFQNFATHSFTKMLSEGRKYKLRVTLAEQSTSQQDDKNIVNVILANVTTVVCFRTANYIDEELMLNQFAPYITKGDVSNLPKYHFYIKVSALEPEEPFSGKTIYIPLKKDLKKIEKLITASRKNWAIKYQRLNVSKTTNGHIKQAEEAKTVTTQSAMPRIPENETV
jgi:hypothetical protein